MRFVTLFAIRTGTYTTLKHIISANTSRRPGLIISAVPIVFLLTFLGSVVFFRGADAIIDWSPASLLMASSLAIVLSVASGCLCRRGLCLGLRRSARQILPAVPMLIFIAMVSTTWMLSGVVPLLIKLGLQIVAPDYFLVIACVVCGIVSVLTGSSWSTIATIGVAFMGIGTVMGYSPGWIAGAIISGAYFGDKVSPLSDTTVVASSACGVDLFKHIRYLLITTVPALTVALIAFLIKGLTFNAASAAIESDILTHIGTYFNLSPWLAVIPAATILMIVLRVPTLLTLFLGSMMGLAAIFIFQPGLVEWLGVNGVTDGIGAAMHLLWSDTTFDTGSGLFDSLVSTSGIMGMVPTVCLVLSAMIFGTVMIGTGMLGTLTSALTSRLRRRTPLVGATVASGLFLNACTADQYLSIIIGGNMYRSAYRRTGLEPRLLSRTLEDSVSVTSVLIPWNSCGVTQSAVLGVATIAYFPYCIFNYLSPLMTLLISFTGFKIRQTFTAHARPAIS